MESKTLQTDPEVLEDPSANIYLSLLDPETPPSTLRALHTRMSSRLPTRRRPIAVNNSYYQ